MSINAKNSVSAILMRYKMAHGKKGTPEANSTNHEPRKPPPSSTYTHSTPEPKGRVTPVNGYSARPPINSTGHPPVNNMSPLPVNNVGHTMVNNIGHPLMAPNGPLPVNTVMNDYTTPVSNSNIPLAPLNSNMYPAGHGDYNYSIPSNVSQPSLLGPVPVPVPAGIEHVPGYSADFLSPVKYPIPNLYYSPKTVQGNQSLLIPQMATGTQPVPLDSTLPPPPMVPSSLLKVLKPYEDVKVDTKKSKTAERRRQKKLRKRQQYLKKGSDEDQSDEEEIVITKSMLDGTDKISPAQLCKITELLTRVVKSEGKNVDNPKSVSLVEPLPPLPPSTPPPLPKELPPKTVEKTDEILIEKITQSLEKSSKLVEKPPKPIEKTRISVEKTQKSVEKSPKKVELYTILSPNSPTPSEDSLPENVPQIIKSLSESYNDKNTESKIGSKSVIDDPYLKKRFKVKKKEFNEELTLNSGSIFSSLVEFPESVLTNLKSDLMNELNSINDDVAKSFSSHHSGKSKVEPGELHESYDYMESLISEAPIPSTSLKDRLGILNQALAEKENSRTQSKKEFSNPQNQDLKMDVDSDTTCTKPHSAEDLIALATADIDENEQSNDQNLMDDSQPEPGSIVYDIFKMINLEDDEDDNEVSLGTVAEQKLPPPPPPPPSNTDKPIKEILNASTDSSPSKQNRVNLDTRLKSMFGVKSSEDEESPPKPKKPTQNQVFLPNTVKFDTSANHNQKTRSLNGDNEYYLVRPPSPFQNKDEYRRWHKRTVHYRRSRELANLKPYLCNPNIRCIYKSPKRTSNLNPKPDQERYKQNRNGQTIPTTAPMKSEAKNNHPGVTFTCTISDSKSLWISNNTNNNIINNKRKLNETKPVKSELNNVNETKPIKTEANSVNETKPIKSEHTESESTPMRSQPTNVDSNQPENVDPAQLINLVMERIMNELKDSIKSEFTESAVSHIESEPKRLKTH